LKASVLNRDVNLDGTGSFIVDAPVPNGVFRARIICDDDENEALILSNFVNGVPNGAVEFTEFLRQNPSINPTELIMTSNLGTMSPGNNVAQLRTQAVLTDGTILDMSNTTGLGYRSSNPNIVSVTESGMATGLATGRAFITAEFAGLVATFNITVNLTNDSDGDGLPDGFEDANSINPGGINLTQLPGTSAGYRCLRPREM